MKETVASTVTKDWSLPDSDYPMKQEDNGNMKYMENKKKIMSKDASTIRSQMRNQSGAK